GLGGRTGLRAGGNRRPGGEAAGVGDGGRPDVVDRSGPGPKTGCTVGMPTARRIRGLALRVGRPVSLLRGQQPAALLPMHLGPSIRHAAPFWSLRPLVACAGAGGRGRSMALAVGATTPPDSAYVEW